MNIKRFNENEFYGHYKKVQDVDRDNILKRLFDEELKEEYVLYGEYIWDEEGNERQSIKQNAITNGYLEHCLEFYNIHNNKRLKGDYDAFDNLFLVKQFEKTELITKDELALLLDSKKYNL